MFKVAITGNIASGKSTVGKILEEKGFKVLDTDNVAHNLLNNEKISHKIKNTFEKFDILENNEISRPKLGKIIFEDEGLRKKLENILHPEIKKEIDRFFCSNKYDKISFVSVPLLFEAKFEDLFDKIILIYSEDKLRLERLMKRNDLSEEHAKNRIKIQISQDKKISLADYIIYNNKTLNHLRKEVEKLVKLDYVLLNSDYRIKKTPRINTRGEH